jgi:zinc protease
VGEIKENLIKNYTAAGKLNIYWATILLTKDLWNLDTYTGWEETIKAQTPESIAAFARQLCGTGNKIEVVMTPAE